MSKQLVIYVVDDKFNPIDSNMLSRKYHNNPFINESDCINIRNSLKTTTIRTDDILTIIDPLIAYFGENELEQIIVDVEEREKEYAPAKEMTISEIEKALGYKVKIVQEGKHND